MGSVAVQAGIVIDTFDCSGIGATFVDGYFLRQAMQVDGALQVAPRCCQIPLGGEQEVNRVAALVHGAVQVLPLTSHFDIRFIHPPAGTDLAFATAEN